MRHAGPTFMGANSHANFRDDALDQASSVDVVPLSVRNSQRIIVAREERGDAQRSFAKHMSGQTEAAIAKKASDKRYMAEVDAFLADTSSAFAKVVPARTVVDTRRRRGK